MAAGAGLGAVLGLSTVSSLRSVVSSGGGGNTGEVDLAAKLQLRPEQGLCPVGAPDTVASTLGRIPTDEGTSSALLVFAVDRAVLDAQRTTIVVSARADRLTWVAYPQSGQLGTDLNRDSLAASLSGDGVRAMRQVAIDDVWSALRFRPA